MPAFEESGGFCLSESNAIAYYVADDALRGGPDAVNRALVQQWMSFGESELLPAACTWVFPVLGIMPPQHNKQVTERAKEDLKKAMAALNQHLLHSTFVVGERITLADVCLCCNLLMAYQHVLDPNTRYGSRILHCPNCVIRHS